MKINLLSDVSLYLCRCMRHLNILSSYAVKTRIVHAAAKLHALGLLAPCAWCAFWAWRCTGRFLIVAKFAFWLNVLAERFTKAQQILTHHQSSKRPTSHVAWSSRVQGDLQDRMPVDIEALRQALPARCASAKDLDANKLIYILSASLPQMQAGYAHRSHGLVKALSAKGVDATCVTRPGFPMDVVNLSDPEDAPQGNCSDTVDGITYHRIASPLRKGRSGLSYIDAASHTLDAFVAKQPPAVVMAASNHISALPALMAARRAGLPFVYEVRGFWEITNGSRDASYQNSVRYRNAVALETLTAQEADMVFTLNRPMEKELVRRGVPQHKIKLLPNACEPDKFTPRARDEELAQELGITPNTTVIGFAGSFTPYEGLDELILACGELRRRGHDFRLLLVGDEAVFNRLQIRLLPQLHALIAQERLHSYVHFAGRVPSEDVPRWYSLIDIAPFPRKAMAVSELVPPLKPIEAMAMQKAVIASDVGALSDFVQDGVTGLMFPKGDINAFADSLEKLLYDKALRRSLGENGRAWVVAERSWSRIASIVHDALREICNDK